VLGSGVHLDLPSFPTRRSSDLLFHVRRALVSVQGAGKSEKSLGWEAGSADVRVSLAIFPRVLRDSEPGEALTRPVRRSTFCPSRSEEHTSELQSRENLVCRLLL